jgi:hypothetical protein
MNEKMSSSTDNDTGTKDALATVALIVIVVVSVTFWLVGR